MANLTLHTRVPREKEFISLFTQLAIYLPSFWWGGARQDTGCLSLAISTPRNESPEAKPSWVGDSHQD